MRYFAESPVDTWENIGPYVRHVHIKDSVMTGAGMQYKMLGYGDLPIAEALSILKSNGFDGFVSLELSLIHIFPDNVLIVIGNSKAARKRTKW